MRSCLDSDICVKNSLSLLRWHLKPTIKTYEKSLLFAFLEKVLNKQWRSKNFIRGA